MASMYPGGDRRYIVANLPTYNLQVGDRAFVLDATTPAFNVAVVGGGAVVAPVYWNGVGWIVG